MNQKAALIGALLSVVLLINIYAIADDGAVLNKKFDMADPFNPKDWDDDKDDGGGGDGGGNDTIIDADFEVILPERMVGDSARFDYDIFLELYDENTTSGEWERYTLTGNGVLRDSTQAVVAQDDGFGSEHQTLHTAVERTFSFTMIIDNSTSDDPLVIHGDGNLFRDTYTELIERQQIQMFIDGTVTVDKIPRYPLPVTFTGSLRTFPDPNVPQDPTLGDRIYDQGQTLDGESQGSFIENEDEIEWLQQTYNWQVDGAEMVAGYKTLHVNVTSKLFDWMDISLDSWIANEVPVPLKTVNRANSTWEWDEGKGYLIIEEGQVLQDGKFTKGEEEVPWAPEGSSGDFYESRPGVEFREWNLMPEGGALFDTINFEFAPEDAVAYAIETSTGLDDFIDDQKGEVVSYAWYNATLYTDANERAGDYYWNLTFEAPYEWDYNEDDDKDWRDIEMRYEITVCKKIRRSGILGDYIEELEIFDEDGLGSGWGEVERNDLPDKILTLAAAEKIIKSYPELESEFYDNRGHLNVDEIKIQYYVSDTGATSMPGLDFLNVLTGIETPSADHSWNFQKNTVWESGETYMAAVDCQSGALVFIMELSGNQLSSIFS